MFCVSAQHNCVLTLLSCPQCLGPVPLFMTVMVMECDFWYNASVCMVTSFQVRHPHAIGLTEGDYIQVKYYGRDPITGRARISRKSLLPLPEPASSIPDNNTGLLDEAEEKRQRSPYSRSRPLQRQNKFERPAFERPGPRPPRYRHSPEGHWSQREGRQAQSHQQRSGYNPKWRTKY